MDIRIEPVNSLYVKVFAEAGIIQELFEHFSFYAPNYKFNPSYRKGWWDGQIRLLNKKTRLIYKGLVSAIKEFAEDREYVVEDNATKSRLQIDTETLEKFITALKVPTKFERREYQYNTILHCINQGNGLILSPTSSGKSFIQYIVGSWFNVVTSKPTLIVVPRINLVKQMFGDFVDYGANPDKIYTIQAGVDKNIPKTAKYVVTTWQSVYKLPVEFFNQFGCICGDEAHDYKAKALTDLMNQSVNIDVRFGFTGTLDGSQTNEMVLRGLFGPVKRFITTRQLIDQGDASDLKINIIMMKHTKENRKALKGAEYEEEISYLISNDYRNKAIVNLALALKGNTLVLFNRVEKHGQILYDTIKKYRENTHLIYGGVPGDDRERIRRIIEKSTDSITAASYQTFSTGANIKNLHNGIFALAGKGKIRNLQSIGRGLRLGNNADFVKEHFTLYDIADDLSNGKKRNHTLKHLLEYRIKQYEEEQFPYQLVEYTLKG